MKSRAKRPTPTPARSPRQNAEGRTVILVRRGALRRFDALTRKTAELPVLIAWDRRVTERRTTPAGTPAERRAADRRQSPPFTWDLADFVVVPATAGAAPEADTPAPASRRRTPQAPQTRRTRKPAGPKR